MNATDVGTTGFAIISNSIYGNGGLGIDLSNDNAVASNDKLDADSGPNNLVNFPVLNYAINPSDITRLGGNVDISPAGAPVVIQLFDNDSWAGCTNGEGQRCLERV